jgi:hypothetical protein
MMIHLVSAYALAASIVVAIYGLLGLKRSANARGSLDLRDHIPRRTLPVALCAAAFFGLLFWLTS